MSALTIFALMLVALVVYLILNEYYTWYKYGPPKGIVCPPTKVPVIGHGLQLYKAGIATYDLMEKWVIEYGGPHKTVAVRLPALESGFLYLTTDLAIIKEVYTKRPHTYGKAKVLERDSVVAGSLFVINDPAEWGRVRRLTSPAFNHGSVDKMLPAIAKVASNLVDKWSKAASKSAAGGEVDALTDFHAYTFDVISLVGFDHFINTLENPDHPFLRDIMLLVRSLVDDLFNIKPWRHLPKDVRDAKERFTNLVKEVLERCMNDTEGTNQTEEDADIRGYTTLLARMITALDSESDRSRMSLDELVANMLIFYTAGTETSGNTASWVMHYLATHPEVQSRAHAEVSQAFPGGLLEECGRLASTAQVVGRLPYCQALVWEALRLKGPVLSNGGTAKKPVSIAGIDFPQDSGIAGMIRLITTDEQYFPRAKNFIPERWLDGYRDPVTAKPLVPEDPDLLRFLKELPFGGGPRICPGKKLAMDEMTIAVAAVVERFVISNALGMEPPREVFAGTMKPSHVTINVQERSMKSKVLEPRTA